MSEVFKCLGSQVYQGFFLMGKKASYSIYQTSSGSFYTKLENKELK